MGVQRQILTSSPACPQQNRSAALREELAGAGRGDILELRDAAGCLQKIIACLRHAARYLSPKPEPSAAMDAGRRHRFDSIIFGDDDAVFHPHRFLLDMAEAADPYLIIGQLSWAGYWDQVRQRHHGFANLPAEVARVLMAPPKHASGDSTIGPFAFPIGMWMGLGTALAQHLAAAVDVEPDLIKMQADLKLRCGALCSIQGRCAGVFRPLPNTRHLSRFSRAGPLLSCAAHARGQASTRPIARRHAGAHSSRRWSPHALQGHRPEVRSRTRLGPRLHPVPGHSPGGHRAASAAT
jgi:hypothetical protein